MKISEEKEQRIVLPVNVSIAFFDRVMKAYFELKAHENPVTLISITEVAGSSKPNISSANSFLIAINAAEKKGREFILTEDGKKYAQAITWGLDDEAKNALRKLLEGYELTKKTISYIKVNPKVTAEDLAKRIGILSGNIMSKGTERAISSFINFLYEAGLIIEDDNFIKAVDADESFTIIKQPVKERVETKSYKFDSNFEAKLTVQVNIDSSMNENDVIKLIRAVRKGLKEPLEEDEIQNSNEV